MRRIRMGILGILDTVRSAALGATAGAAVMVASKYVKKEDFDGVFATISAALRNTVGTTPESPFRLDCSDCARKFGGYMVKDSVWKEALTEAEWRTQYDEDDDPLWSCVQPKPGYRRLYLCPGCVAKRLGRPLKLDDLYPHTKEYWEPVLSMIGPAFDGSADLPVKSLWEEGGKSGVIDAIEFIARHGIYPKEAASILEALILSSRPDEDVFHESPEIPQLADLIALAEERGARHRREQ